jgi:hypothetical protein
MRTHRPGAFAFRPAQQVLSRYGKGVEINWRRRCPLTGLAPLTALDTPWAATAGTPIPQPRRASLKSAHTCSPCALCPPSMCRISPVM